MLAEACSFGEAGIMLNSTSRPQSGVTIMKSGTSSLRLCCSLGQAACSNQLVHSRGSGQMTAPLMTKPTAALVWGKQGKKEHLYVDAGGTYGRHDGSGQARVLRTAAAILPAALQPAWGCRR